MQTSALAAPSRYALSPVIDLRSRLTAAYDLTTPTHPAGLPAALADAAGALGAIGFTGPVQVHAGLLSAAGLANADAWSAVAAGAGLTPQRIDLVIDDGALERLGYADALALMEGWRAHGFGVCMRLRADGPGFPLAKRGRACASEVRVTPEAAARHKTSVLAALEAGLQLTAELTADAPDAVFLRAGFDRRVSVWS